jgi:MATE family multidrug resistance protein
MVVVDAAMLGRYENTALAGMGIASGLYFAISIIGLGIVMGLDTLVPQALGAGERTRARSLLDQGVRTALWVSVPLTVAIALSPLLLVALGVEPTVRAESRDYILYRLPSLAPALVLSALRSYLQARSMLRPVVITMVAGNVINFFANGVLIFGDRALIAVGIPAVGLPALGVRGAALSTTLVVIVSMLIIVMAVRRVHAGEPKPRPEPALKRAIVRLGLPVGLHLFAEIGVFALAAALAGRLGVLPGAAHQIAVTVASATFNVIIGIAVATSMRVGLAVGAGDHHRARRAGFTGISMGAAIMGVSAVVMLSAPELLARLFTADPAVIAVAAPLLRIAAVFQLSDAVQAISAGALRGAGDTRTTMWANIVGHYIVSLSLALLFTFVLEMGAQGLWWGLSAGLTVVAVVLLVRFTRLSSRPIARST